MSNNRCYLCGCDPGVFFVWSSSRLFDRDKLMDIRKRQDKQFKSMLKQGVKVCFECNRKLKEE